MADLPKPVNPQGAAGKKPAPGAKAPAGKTPPTKGVPPKPPAEPVAAVPDAKAKKTDIKTPAKKSVVAFDNVDVIPNEAVAIAKHKKLLQAVTIQAIVLGCTAIILIVSLPFFQTRYQYYSMTPESQVNNMTPLTMPNLTDSAIKAWAANSVTEILTIGFGDYDKRLASQQHRFTPEGWYDFVHTFFEKKIGETLKKDQLVLTTVPSEDPEITSQNINPKHVYEWTVSVPVIMTYATNNDVTKPQSSTVKLTIVRVPYDEQNSGIAIDIWRQ